MLLLLSCAANSQKHPFATAETVLVELEESLRPRSATSCCTCKVLPSTALPTREPCPTELNTLRLYSLLPFANKAVR